jgi:DNA polymerase-3 subunit gamma/tau
LRRIDAEAISRQLVRICDTEKAQIDKEGLALIAQEAAGSMRDGLSLLDHVLSCAEGPVTAQSISDLLGVVERKHLFDISGAVFAHDIRTVLEKIDAAWRHGYEIKRFYADLVAHFHHLSVLKMGSGADQLVDLPHREIERMKSQVADVPQSYLLQIFELLFQAEPSIKLSSQPRMALEMIFLKLFQTAPALPIDTLIRKLDKLRSDLPVVPSPATTSGPAVGSGTASAQQAAPPAAARQAHPAGQSPKRKDMEGIWRQIQSEVAEKKPSLAAFLNSCTPLSLTDGSLELDVKGSAFTLKNIKKQLGMLESACSQVVGCQMRIKLVENILDSRAEQQKKKETNRLKQDALSHPMVMEAVEVFDGRVIDVKIKDSQK